MIATAFAGNAAAIVSRARRAGKGPLPPRSPPLQTWPTRQTFLRQRDGDWQCGKPAEKT